MFRLRRAAATLVLGVGVGGSVIGAATVAGAATAGGGITATSAPSIATTGSNQAAGTLAVSLSSSLTLATGKALDLKIAALGGGKVLWKTWSVSTSGIKLTTTPSLTTTKTTLIIRLGAKAAGTAATVTVTGVRYTTTAAKGTLTVTPTLTGVATTWTPSSASNATLPPAPPAAPTGTLKATGAPHVAVGRSDQTAGTWTLTLEGKAGQGWTAGDYVLVSVANTTGANCSGNDFVVLAQAPAAAVTATGTSTAPAVSTSLTSAGTCNSLEPDVVKVAFTNSGTFSSPTTTGSATVTLSSVRYTLGSTAKTGAVKVTASYHAGSSSTPVTTTAASNAVAGGVYVTADSPAVTVVADAFDAPISSVDVVEASPTHLPAGYVCVTAGKGHFYAPAVPAVKVAAGNGAVASKVAAQGVAATDPTGATAWRFQVTAASTTTGVYAISGLAVDAATAGPVAVTVTDGSSATCSSDTTTVGSATAYTVAAKTAATQIYGSTADATAVAELEHEFAPSGSSCPGTTGARPVVLATDADYPDALSSAYLASYLKTGELLTPTASLSSVTANAIREEGISHVYVVGGPLAVSTAVVDQLGATPAYKCGGTTAATGKIQVTRISGQTEYDTAAQVAGYPSATQIGKLEVTGAYAGTNGSGGDGRYNDTAGSASGTPATSAAVATAVVATGAGFQDAESASTLAYAEHLPILLTTPSSLSTQAAATVVDLGIQQAIVMGGPLAVSNAVVSALESLGVSVLRIAGQDASDTAVQLADFEMGSSTGHVGLAWTPTDGVTVARGDFYSDGLAGAVVAAGGASGSSREPLLLTTDPATVGAPLTKFLQQAGKTGIDGDKSAVTTLTVLGGPDAVAPATVRAMETDLKS